MKKRLFSILALTIVSAFGIARADEYTAKTVHDKGDKPEYKHSGRSYTGPFDYAPCVEATPRPWISIV